MEPRSVRKHAVGWKTRSARVSPTFAYTTTAPQRTSASSLSARAFTIGNQIAFAGGQFRPGTLTGDALIAHELAHVLQQRSSGLMRADLNPTAETALERDADRAAVGAIGSLWRGVRDFAGGWAALRRPNLASGLSLQRCKDNPYPDPAVGPIPDYDAFSHPSGEMKDGNATAAMIQNWEQLDRVYADADAGEARAKRFIKDLEQTFAATGVYTAEKTAQPDCLIPAYRELKGAVFDEGCVADWSSVSYLRTEKTGGIRLRQVIGEAYEKRAKELNVRNEIILHGLNLVMAGVALKGALGKGGTAVESGPGKTIADDTAAAAKGEASAVKPGKVEPGKAATGEVVAGEGRRPRHSARRSLRSRRNIRRSTLSQRPPSAA